MGADLAFSKYVRSESILNTRLCVFLRYLHRSSVHNDIDQQREEHYTRVAGMVFTILGG